MQGSWYQTRSTSHRPLRFSVCPFVRSFEKWASFCPVPLPLEYSSRLTVFFRDSCVTCILLLLLRKMFATPTQDRAFFRTRIGNLLSGWKNFITAFRCSRCFVSRTIASSSIVGVVLLTVMWWLFVGNCSHGDHRCKG